MQPQFMTTEEMTDFTYSRGFESVWMVSKCSSIDIDEYTRALCENPEIHASLDSVVPVTDYITHYRNIFCARCNGLSDAFALRWDLKLHCMDYFKINGNNVLQRIVANRCNIFFKRPNSARRPRECIPQSYLISRCNETGLWPSYNKTIDLACGAYNGVYNATYKNIFCFLCNTNSSYDSCLKDSSTCDDARSEVTERTPLFSTMLNMDALKMTDPGDECDSATHFKDEELVCCKKIHAYILRGTRNLSLVSIKSWLFDDKRKNYII